MHQETGPGRRPVTSRQALAALALGLFAERGFDATTVDDIAAAAGISRRSFFRYYASKNDVVWGDFDAGLEEMERDLDQTPDPVGFWSAVTDAVVRFNALPPEAAASHRQRMALILHVPALQAHSTLRYADWRAVISRFAAARLDEPAESLGPQLVAHVALAAAVTGYEAWLRDERADLTALLQQSFGAVDPLLSRHSSARHTSPDRRRG